MTSRPIHTIGYGARSIDAFVAVLQTLGIEYLIDVRSRPYSRHKPEFSKAALQSRLRSHGIRYVFMGDSLGGLPDDPAARTNGEVDCDRLSRLPTYRAGIDRLRKAWEQQLPVAIMCSEGKPEMCHRSQLIGTTLVAEGIGVAHVDENDRLITQTDVELRRSGGQPGLFNAPVQPRPAMPPPPPPEPEPPPFEPTYIPNDLGDIPPVLSQFTLPPGSAQPLTLDAARDSLKQVFGFDDFRPLQADIIQSVLDRRDALAVMPTGGGKSLTFQLPALLFPGLTVVVSPLISLMQDQVDQLQQWGIPAVTLNSTLSFEQYKQTVGQIRRGAVKLLYVAPETLLSASTLALLEQSRVDCLAIDEAHCISAWGHDFRPEYRQLVNVRRRLPRATCLALTATATPRVREDIKETLGIAGARVFVASFDRENLFLAVEPRKGGLRQVTRFLRKRRGESGIIYCTTRRQVEELTADLEARGFAARAYHAGLSDQTRQDNQRAFVNDEADIIVATVAFGMGIDKPDVRFVVHYNLPKNIESYYQEIGRAGRDGLRADCLLLLDYSDVSTINYFIRQQKMEEQPGAYARLQALLKLVESIHCRRKPLLSYFGETYGAETCDMCDNCLQGTRDLVDLTSPARQFLKCVRSTGQVFAMNFIIDVLRGSRSRRVLNKGYDQLSMYGAGKAYTRDEWQKMARQFIQQGLLTQNPRFGVLKLTQEGERVVEGKERVQGTAVSEKRQPSTKSPKKLRDSPASPELFELLRARRSSIAAKKGVPPYTILAHRSLIEMATVYPQTRDEFREIYGVGRAKAVLYADDFLEVIRDFCAEHDITG